MSILWDPVSLIKCGIWCFKFFPCVSLCKRKSLLISQGKLIFLISYRFVFLNFKPWGSTIDWYSNYFIGNPLEMRVCHWMVFLDHFNEVPPPSSVSTHLFIYFFNVRPCIYCVFGISIFLFFIINKYKLLCLLILYGATQSNTFTMDTFIYHWNFEKKKDILERRDY